MPFGRGRRSRKSRGRAIGAPDSRSCKAVRPRLRGSPALLRPFSRGSAARQLFLKLPLSIIVHKSQLFKNRKAKILNNYFKTTSIVHLIYTLLNVIFAFVTSWLIVGIIPLALHMIVSSIILWNMKDRLSWNTGETHVVDFWWAAELGSFVIAFLSVIVASAIAG